MQATITVDNKGLVSTRFSRPLNPVMDSDLFDAFSRVQASILRAGRRLGLTPVMDGISSRTLMNGLGGYDLWFRPRDGRMQPSYGRLVIRLDSAHLPQFGAECLPGLPESERSFRALALENVTDALNISREEWHEKAPGADQAPGAGTNGKEMRPCVRAQNTTPEASPRQCSRIPADVPTRRGAPRSHTLVYLAGPYSAPAGMTPDAARALQADRAMRHAQAAAWLKGQGFSVLSPIAMGHYIGLAGVTLAPAADFAGWQHECLALLDMCDVMVVLDLPGLERSTGVDMEMGHAARLGLPVRLMVPETHGQDYRLQDIDVAGWWALRRGRQ